MIWTEAQEGHGMSVNGNETRRETFGEDRMRERETSENSGDKRVYIGEYGFEICVTGSVRPR